jgi:hypothetical protein
MATNKKGPLDNISPWLTVIIAGIVVAIGIFEVLKEQWDSGIVKPYTHFHYVDIKSGEFLFASGIDVVGPHRCDGKFINVRAEKATDEQYQEFGFTEAQIVKIKKALNQDKA